jgi:hypothetical protein
VEVIEAKFRTFKEALDYVKSVISVQVPGFDYDFVSWAFTPYLVQIKFKVDSPKQFVFWKTEDKPIDNDGLHIIPAYHPVMNGKNHKHVINGTTGSNIRGKVVDSVYSPVDNEIDMPVVRRNWLNQTHPCKAAGSSVNMIIDIIQILSAEGVNELLEVLQDALKLSDNYVGVIGGFAAPLVSPHNLCVYLKVKSPYVNANRGGSPHLARGSEDYCVWIYRVLEQENNLKGAYIPDWFFKEGWLEFYERYDKLPDSIKTFHHR